MHRTRKKALAGFLFEYFEIITAGFCLQIETFQTLGCLQCCIKVYIFSSLYILRRNRAFPTLLHIKAMF
jgi:hypothetical protein